MLNNLIQTKVKRLKEKKEKKTNILTIYRNNIVLLFGIVVQIYHPQIDNRNRVIDTKNKCFRSAFVSVCVEEENEIVQQLNNVINKTN